jgi:uncharacterized membrane protein YeaQ/YmgE (transglycosylase-associated protein family)|tara:strand:+ start:660 stop:905 length:246 start_codon:yes stop_codon:yes gene_type:complete
MSQKSEQNAGAFMDTVIVIVGLAILGMVVYNFITIGSVAGAIEANTMHTCWIMEYIIGEPEAHSQEACANFREQLTAWWNR